MNFNLVEMYNGLLRFNKHILNELAEGLKHLPNLDGVSKGDSLIINEQGNPAWGSAWRWRSLRFFGWLWFLLF